MECFTGAGDGRDSGAAAGGAAVLVGRALEAELALANDRDRREHHRRRRVSLARLRALEVCLLAPALEPGFQRAFFVSGGRVVAVGVDLGSYVQRGAVLALDEAAMGRSRQGDVIQSNGVRTRRNGGKLS